MKKKMAAKRVLVEKKAFDKVLGKLIQSKPQQRNPKK
jgi:hypothetical protein